MKCQCYILIYFLIFTNGFGISQISEQDSGLLNLDSVYYKYQIVETDTTFSETLYVPVGEDTSLDMYDNLRISGVKDFSFDMDRGFDQGLRVRIGGEVEGVGIEGTLSDKATASSTIQISEVEKMNFRIFTNNFEGGLGNLSLKLPFGIRDEIQGARIGIHTSNQENGVGFSYAINRGMNKRKRFNGEEGKQSPYLLEPPVITNSERVHLAQGIGQSKLMEADKDYIIDYERGILSFTNKNIITNHSRIEVEYKQAIDDYPNIYAQSDGEIAFRNITFTGIYRRRYDEKENPLTFTISAQEKDSLRATGDTSIVFHTYADSSAEGDYIIDNNHFVYVGTDSGEFTVTFFHVGENNGEYIYNPNIKAFSYLGPGLGNYSPTKLLPLPEKDEFYGLGINIFDAIQLNAYGSVLDKNTFSAIDDNDNFGRGFHMQLKKQLSIFTVDGKYISYDERFSKPQGKEEIDYQYEWHTNEPLEELTDIVLGINPKPFLRATVGYGLFNRTHKRKSVSLHPFFFNFGYQAIDSINKYYAGFAKKQGKFALKSQYEYTQEIDVLSYDIQYWMRTNSRLGISGSFDQDSINKGITTIFDIITLPLSISIGHRLYNDTTFFFGNIGLNIQHRYGAIIGNLEQSQRYSQKRDENYVKVDDGTGNYVFDSLTGTYVEKNGGDYIKKIYLLQEFERVVNRNYGIEASYRQSIFDIKGRFYYAEENDFKSNFGELLVALSDDQYELEFNVHQDLTEDARFVLFEISNRERLFSIAPSYKTLSGRIEIKQVLEQHNTFISEKRDSYGGKIAWRVLSKPILRPELGYFYSEIFSSYFADTDLLLYQPQGSMLIGIPFKTKGRFELTGELIYRRYNLDPVPYFFAAADPPGLTKIVTATASLGFGKHTMFSLIYRIEFDPDDEFRQNLRFQTKIRF